MGDLYRMMFRLTIVGVGIVALLLGLMLGVVLGDVQDDVEYFAADARNGRATRSDGMKESKIYVMAALGEYGIPAYMQPAAGCHNIVATMKGTQPETYIVVGAHLDHLGVRRGKVMNGADDNASGSAALLELAGRLSMIKTRRSIVLVWFTGEERGLLGSKSFVRGLDQMPVFMVNLDMVGRLSDDLPGSKGKPGSLAPLFKKYDFAKRVTYRDSKLGSDQVPFNGKCPTVFLHTGLHRLYHTSADDPGTLDYDGIELICDYAYDMIVQVVGLDYRLYGGSE